MKKKYFTYAGIIAALILVGMFIGICLSSFPFPFLPPAITIDPITDRSVDENNMMILTGLTTYPENTDLSVTVSASPDPLSQGNGTERTKVKTDAVIVQGDEGRNHWRAVFDISDLQAADYTISLANRTVFIENFTIIESDSVATAHFTLGDENAGPGSIRKKNPVTIPFIRINAADQSTTAGDLIITGITNLGAGTPLTWSMHPVTSGTVNNTQEPQGTTTVITGTMGINRWTVLPGTGTTEPARHRFSISAYPTGNTYPAGMVTASSEFVIPRVPATLTMSGTVQVPPGFITIDTLPEMRVNNVYMLTGTTSLPAGKYLMVRVEPASFETDYNFSLDAKETSRNRTLSGAAVFSGVAGGISVVNGSNGNNLWSFRLETYRLSPGQYQLNVSNDDYNYGAESIIYGDLFRMIKFPVEGDTP
jgi:hypothetical protein